MFKKALIIIFVLFVVVACNKKKSMLPDEYLKHLNSEDGGLIRTKEFSNILFRIKIQTPEIMLLSNFSDSLWNHENFNKNLLAYNDKLNFIILIEDTEGNNEVKRTVVKKESYSQILSYGNTELKNDFKLLQGADTFYCALAIVEPANTLQPVVRIAISFSGLDPQRENDMTLVYNDKIFGRGPVKFNYSKNIFQNIPELKF